MRIHSKYFPPDIRDQYHIDELVAADGYVYIKTIEGMYELKHAAIISYNHLSVPRLAAAVTSNNTQIS